MNKKCDLAIILICLYLVLSGCDSGSDEKRNVPAVQGVQASHNDAGVPEELMRRFNLMITLRGETMRQAIMRMMEKELVRFEECFQNQEEESQTAFPFRKPEIAEKPQQDEHYAICSDISPWSVFFPSENDTSMASAIIIYHCDDFGPVWEAIEVQPIDEILLAGDIRSLLTCFRFNLSELPGEVRQLVLDRVKWAWEYENDIAK